MKLNKLLISITLIIGFIGWSNFDANAQIDPPIILPGNMNIVVEKYVQIPDFGGARPLINSFDIQGNRLFASDTEGGYIYQIVENPSGPNIAFVYFDVRTAMQSIGRNLNLENNIHGGLQDFAFHPEFTTNGKFYTSIMEDRPANPSATEPGRDNIEEVNIITAGENYGWSEREGTYVHLQDDGGLINGITPLPANDANFGYTYPSAQWIHTGPVGAGFVGQAIAGGHNYTDATNGINHCVFGDFPISGRLFYCDMSDLVNQKTKLNPGESPQALTQSQIFEYTLWFDHDNNPNTDSVSRDNMLDVINDEASYSGQRADLRFGNDSQGNLYISSKRNGWVYKVKEVFSSTQPMVDCPTINANIGDACNDATLKLIDLYGKEFKSVRLENISQNTFQIPLEVEDGIYAIWILSDDGKPIAKQFLVNKEN